MEYLLTQERSFAECKQDNPGTIYYDEIINGFRCLVMRGPFSLCAYVGVPEGHKLYGVDYYKPDIQCHGGLTFSDKGGDKRYPSGWWFFGWDYAHFGDAVFYHYLSGIDFEWCVEHVIRDVAEVVKQFMAMGG